MQRGIFLFLMIINCLEAFASKPSNTLEGYNWYSENIGQKDRNYSTKPSKDIEENNDENKNLPEYEKNIRNLQKSYNRAHRRALDNPTIENILVELRLEKEMMNKSKLYGEKRVLVARQYAEFTDMDSHSNVLHRKVSEISKQEKNLKNLKKMSKEWGLILQISDGCPHCHVFAPIVLEIAEEYGFEVLAASSKGKNFHGIKGVKDKGEMILLNPNRDTPILYLVKSDGREVIPISRGVNSALKIIENINAVNTHFKRLF